MRELTLLSNRECRIVRAGDDFGKCHVVRIPTLSSSVSPNLLLEVDLDVDLDMDFVFPK
jgi:hypothetical protein